MGSIRRIKKRLAKASASKRLIKVSGILHRIKLTTQITPKKKKKNVTKSE